jgi:hypothetical protein
MLALIDGRVSKEVKETLSRYCEFIEFRTHGITYEAVAGHPDLFFCKLGDTLVTAANLPAFYQGILKDRGIGFLSGTLSVGDRYPESARYNAAATDAFLVHRLDITDPRILESAAGLEKLSVAQGYARCSLLPLDCGRFISSDAGITAALVHRGLGVLHVENKNIALPGFECGFFGGACGFFCGRVFVIGSLDYFPDGERARRYLGGAGYEIIELADSPLYDGGTILFL